MFGLLKCQHPFKYLHVQKQPTRGSFGKDFFKDTMHLYCMKCGKKNLDIKYATPIGGVDAMFGRWDKEIKEANNENL